jgi:CRISPR-associated endonuclease/helicase Cas3
MTDGVWDDIIAAVCIHDIGKLTQPFQDRWEHDASRAGHSVPGMAILTALETHGLPEHGVYIPLFIRIGPATIAHHGKPVPESDILEASQLDADTMASVAQHIAILGRDGHRPWTAPDPWWDWMDHPKAHALRAQWMHLISGLTQLSDWIGSDTAYFDYDRLDTTRTWDECHDRAQRAVTAIGLAHGARPVHIGFTVPGIRDACPRGVQEVIGNMPAEPGLTIIEADTGSGKTEAAYWHAIRLMEQHHIDGITIALPTRASAHAIHARLTAMAAITWPDETVRPVVIRAIPGAEGADGADRVPSPTTAFEVMWDDHRSDAGRWAATNAKRFFAGRIVITTIDQVILSILPVKHADMRSFALLRHMIIMDEIHASDAYQMAFVHRLIQTVRGLGGSLVLMTATWTAHERQKALDIWNGKTDVRTGDSTIDDDAAMPYGLVTTANHRGHVSHIASPSDRRDRIIHVSTMGVDYGTDDASAESAAHAVAETAIRLAHDGCQVLIIRNTVKDAIALAIAITGKGCGHLMASSDSHPIIHHARFADGDRELLDMLVQHHLRHDRSLASGSIVIGTTTLQQSLDIDADVLITDLAPIDHLYQRSGRIHRHRGTPRASSAMQASMIVIVPHGNPDDAFEKILKARRAAHGWGTVYDDMRILHGTWASCLHYPIWHLPRDARRLMESVMHPEVVSRYQRDDRWSSHLGSIHGHDMANAAIGSILAKSSDTWSAGLAMDERLSTRMGQQDIILRKSDHHGCPEKTPWGRSWSTIRIPYAISRYRGDPDDIMSSIAPSSDGWSITMKHPSMPEPIRLKYDRYGLQSHP